jgi:FixJ family two-component response regulator
VSRVLIADDQRDVLEALRILLKGEGHQTESVTSVSGIFNALQQRDYALLMMDLNYTRDTTSGQEGLEVIPKIQALDSTLPIVVMTAWATIDLAVEAMKRGARDFVPKPWDNQRLLTIVRTQIELASALRKGRKLEAANKLLGGNVPNLIADAPSMRPVIEMISRVAPSDANVLITGENGTGKSLIAQALHAFSLRASHSMITVFRKDGLAIASGQDRQLVGNDVEDVAGRCDGKSAAGVCDAACCSRLCFADRLQQRRESVACAIHRSTPRDRIANGDWRIARGHCSVVCFRESAGQHNRRFGGRDLGVATGSDCPEDGRKLFTVRSHNPARAFAVSARVHRCVVDLDRDRDGNLSGAAKFAG